MRSTRRFFLQTVALPLAASSAGFAFAKDPFPSRPIKLLVGFAAGGLTDIAARGLAQRMSKTLGQNVLVENRPGGQTIIATVAGARAEPDGYTLTFAGTNGMILNPLLYNNLPYSQADFKYLGSMGRSPMLLIVHNDLGVNNVQEFIALAKKKPGDITCAHAGHGVINHLALLHFQSKTGTKFTDVPYKGSGPALIDLMAGTVQSTFDFPTSALGGLQAGKYKALAVTADKRNAALPNVPTMAEAGVKDVEVYSWQAAAAPKGLPADIRARLEKDTIAGLKSPEMTAKFNDIGFDVVANSSKDFEAFLKAEIARWKTVIEVGKIKAE